MNASQVFNIICAYVTAHEGEPVVTANEEMRENDTLKSDVFWCDDLYRGQSVMECFKTATPSNFSDELAMFASDENLLHWVARLKQENPERLNVALLYAKS